MALSIRSHNKSAAVAAFMVVAVAILSISVFPTTDASEVAGDIIVLEDFASPQHKWVEMNDPVMGGTSTGTFSVDHSTTEDVGIFHGTVEIVSFLNAPGFIKAETTKGESWPDVSTCEGLRFVLRSATPSYQGFRVSFGNKKPPHSFQYTYGFKANLHLDGDDSGFQTVDLPFDQFTDKWDAGTGDAVVTCAENKEFCPDEASKKDLFAIAVWGEGVEGEVDLEIQSVAAYGCHPPESDDSSDSSAADAIVIEDFSNPVHDWRTMNDPVMGGRSTSSVSVGDGMASFEGICAIVPFLRAPGFITMTTGVHVTPGGFLGRLGKGSNTESNPVFPDVSKCKGLALTLRTTVDYEGYYVSFGTDRAPGGRHAIGYKRHLYLEASETFGDVALPFSDFSSKWDDATGKTTVTCRDDSRFCPSLETLRDMKTISFWGEGVEGTIALEIRHIGAYGCGSGTGGEAGVATSAVAGLEVGMGPNGSSPKGTMLGMVALCAAVAFGLGSIAIRRSRRKSPEYEEVGTVEASLA